MSDSTGAFVAFCAFIVAGLVISVITTAWEGEQ